LDSSGGPLIDLFAIELKKGYNGHTIADLLDKPSNGADQQWEKWMAEVEEAAEQSGALSWLLFTKRDRRSELVFMEWWVAVALGYGFCGMARDYYLGRICFGHDVAVMNSDWFFATTTPTEIKALAKMA